jgi:DNA-binding MarR family transcriptional regulator/N-acetylglutamate synthase-like GNAT family acetyltransferase
MPMLAAMSQAPRTDAHIAAVRHFNRFYTRHIGLLRKTYLGSPYSLGELRVLYEIIHAAAPTASEIARALDIDAGYLSRVLRDFEQRDLITRKASARDARQSHLALTARGRRAFMPLERHTQRQVRAMLEGLRRPDRDRLVAAMATIESLLGEPSQEPAPRTVNYILRGPRHGDFGWIVKRHAELYAAEYGWIEPFEGLCAQIVADFVNNYDPRIERCWIAEANGENVGSVMLVKDAARVARLRLLLVDPKARGLGLGAHLTSQCIAFARAAGYRKIALWTHGVLKAARHIYKQAGFKLVRSERRESWGQPVVSERWELDL